jgi:branched-chain amino acid transport system permease protein
LPWGAYSPIAIGWTVVFGIVGLINWTHSEVFMIGAFVGYFLVSYKVNLLVALVLAMFAGSFTACFINRLTCGAERTRGTGDC